MSASNPDARQFYCCEDNRTLSTPIATYVVATVAALRAMSTTLVQASETAQTLNYAAIGDGDGNLYYWNSTSVDVDNGGTVIKAADRATGRWLASDSRKGPLATMLIHAGTDKIGSNVKDRVIAGDSLHYATYPDYLNPARYTEVWTNGDNVTGNNPKSDWGNPWKEPAELIEVRTGPLARNEVNGLAIRVRDEVTRTVGGGLTLVGISAAAQAASPVGQTNPSVFAANFEAKWESGLTPTNVVGIETDIILPEAAGVTSGVGDNFTAFWAQSSCYNQDASNRFNTCAFQATGANTFDSTPNVGWVFGAYFYAPFQNSCLNVTNLYNAASANGAVVNIARVNADASILNLLSNGVSRFNVTGAGATSIIGTLSASGHTTFEGVTSTGATGTGKLVYDTAPTLSTPTLGVASATSVNIASGPLGLPFVVHAATNRNVVIDDSGSTARIRAVNDANNANVNLQIFAPLITLTGGAVAIDSHTPSSATDTGTAGTITWDASYIYIAVGANSWKRVAIAAW